MNSVNLIGRLVREPEAKIPSKRKKGDTAVCHYTLAVNRKIKDKTETAFIRCTCFNKMAEVAGQYFHKGTKVAVTGRIVTGSYTNRDGVKIFTTDVIVERQEFAERKAAPAAGFMNITAEEEASLPFA